MEPYEHLPDGGSAASGANATKIDREPRKRVLKPKVNSQALTSAERTPLLLQLLEQLERDGAAGFARTFDKRHIRGNGPKRLTNRERARYLLAELEQYEYMARMYEQEADGIAADAARAAEGGEPDYDLDGRIDGDARRERDARTGRRLSPASELRSLRLLYGTTGKGPSTADLERRIRYWAERYGENGRRLRAELGPSFLTGTWEQREAHVRLWRHRYRKAGLLENPSD